MKTEKPPAPRAPASPPPTTPSTPMSLRAYAIMVGVGAFATTFAQSRILAQFPTTFLLKEYFHFQREDVAFFFFWVTFPWNVKPLVGILTDAFPLFGTRRRHYMIFGSIGAVLMWIAMGPASSAYLPLLYASLGMNIATVFASTVMGGLMVEAGQAYGAPGRMTSLRQATQSVATIVAPLIGGYLAGKAFGWTAGIGAASALSLAICAFFVLREPRKARGRQSSASGERAQRPPVIMILGLAGMTIAATLLFRVADLRQVAYSLFGLVAAFAIIILLAVTPTTNAVILGAQRQLSQIFRSKTLWLA